MGYSDEKVDGLLLMMTVSIWCTNSFIRPKTALACFPIIPHANNDLEPCVAR